MKKSRFLLIILSVIVSLQAFCSASAASLIEYMLISLKTKENPKRLEVSFELTETIDLSQGGSDIVFEYFVKDEHGDLTMVYRKDKSWGGYLNSYDNYPSGERKYSSGASNGAYPDIVPPARIYTSVKTNASIDVSLVDAVRITVLRADGSGGRITIYSDGTTSDMDRIEVPVIKENPTTGIILESSTADIPAGTALTAEEIVSGEIYEKVSVSLDEAKSFIIFEIKLDTNGTEISPDKKVKINIPVPDGYNISRLAVFRFDEDGTKTEYPVKAVTIDGIEYASFETDHFSTYVLADISETEINDENTEDETPAEQEPDTEPEPSPPADENDEEKITEQYEVPKTDDNGFAIFIVSAMTFVLSAVLLVRNKHKHTGADV